MNAKSAAETFSEITMRAVVGGRPTVARVGQALALLPADALVSFSHDLPQEAGSEYFVLEAEWSRPVKQGPQDQPGAGQDGQADSAPCHPGHKPGCRPMNEPGIEWGVEREWGVQGGRWLIECRNESHAREMKGANGVIVYRHVSEWVPYAEGAT